MGAIAATNARRLDCPKSGRRKHTNMPLMPVYTASVNAAKPVARGSVSHQIDCCGTFKNHLSQQAVMLIKQHPYFVERRSRDSRSRRPCSRRVRSTTRVGTRPAFSGLGAARLYRSWTVHQSLQPLTAFRFDFSFCLSRVSYVVFHPRLPLKF